MGRNIITLFVSLAVLSGCSKDDKAGQPGGNGWNDEPEVTTAQVVVMSYNIRHCAPYQGSGVTTEPDEDGIAKVIASKKPDVVMLQEVDSCTNRSNKVDQLKKIAEYAKYPYYRFFKIMDYQGGKYGMAILSQKPIKEAVTYQLPDVIDGHAVTSNNAVGKAVITIDGTDIAFISSHLSTSQSDRDVQLPYIHDNILAKTKQPIVFGGDFNATPSNNTIALLDGYGYLRTNSNPLNYTIPSTVPNRELDYITYYPATKFSVVSHMVITGTTASDHLPIISVLRIDN